MLVETQIDIFEMPNPRTIVVTGANGFVGRNLVPVLMETGHAVTSVFRPGTEPCRFGSKTVFCDLSKNPIPDGTVGPDTLIIHLAAEVTRHGKSTDLETSTNVKMARNLCLSQPSRMIVLSSIAASIADSAPDKARQYGREKSAVDEILRNSLNTGGVITLRAPVIYGHGMRGPVATLTKLIQRKVPLPLGAATEPRSYLSIDNLTSLIANMTVAPEKVWMPLTHTPLEVHDGKRISTRDLVKFIATETNKPARLINIPLPALRLLGKITGKSVLVNGSIDSLDCKNRLMDEKLFGTPEFKSMPESLEFLRSKD